MSLDPQSPEFVKAELDAAAGKLDQILAQNALMADALFDLTKVISQYPSSAAAPFADLIQDAKTKVNALNPTKFVFP